jgi:perosamine synthetase
VSYKLIPRFYYSLSFFRYIFSFSFSLKETSNNFLHDSLKNNKLYFTNYGRTALRLLLSSISKEKLRVGVQAYTCHTIFQAIKKAGHEIVFIDINNQFGLDILDLKTKVSKIDVLIVTHTFGIPENFNVIKKIIGNKIIIEDCCHAFLSKYGNQYVGTCSDASFFSYGIGKLPPIGQGGFCIINNPDKFPVFEELYRKLKFESVLKEILHYVKKCIFSVALKKPLYGLITHKLGKKLDSKYDFVNKFNFRESKGYRLDQKIFLNDQNLFKKLVQSNNKNLDTFSRTNNSGIDPQLKLVNGVISNHYIVPFLIERRNKLYDLLLKNSIESGKHFHNSIKWATKFGYKTGDCRNTERVIDQIITIPLHYGVKTNDIVKIVYLLNEFK